MNENQEIITNSEISNTEINNTVISNTEIDDTEISSSNEDLKLLPTIASIFKNLLNPTVGSSSTPTPTPTPYAPVQIDLNDYKIYDKSIKDYYLELLKTLSESLQDGNINKQEYNSLLNDLNNISTVIGIISKLNESELANVSSLTELKDNLDDNLENMFNVGDIDPDEYTLIDDYLSKIKSLNLPNDIKILISQLESKIGTSADDDFFTEQEVRDIIQLINNIYATASIYLEANQKIEEYNENLNDKLSELNPTVLDNILEYEVYLNNPILNIGEQPIANSNIEGNLDIYLDNLVQNTIPPLKFVEDEVINLNNFTDDEKEIIEEIIEFNKFNNKFYIYLRIKSNSDDYKLNSYIVTVTDENKYYPKNLISLDDSSQQINTKNNKYISYLYLTYNNENLFDIKLPENHITRKYISKNSFEPFIDVGSAYIKICKYDLPTGLNTNSSYLKDYIWSAKDGIGNTFINANDIHDLYFNKPIKYTYTNNITKKTTTYNIIDSIKYHSWDDGNNNYGYILKIPINIIDSSYISDREFITNKITIGNYELNKKIKSNNIKINSNDIKINLNIYKDYKVIPRNIDLYYSYYINETETNTNVILDSRYITLKYPDIKNAITGFEYNNGSYLPIIEDKLGPVNYETYIVTNNVELNEGDSQPSISTYVFFKNNRLQCKDSNGKWSTYYILNSTKTENIQCYIDKKNTTPIVNLTVSKCDDISHSNVFKINYEFNPDNNPNINDIVLKFIPNEYINESINTKYIGYTKQLQFKFTNEKYFNVKLPSTLSSWYHEYPIISSQKISSLDINPYLCRIDATNKNHPNFVKYLLNSKDPNLSFFKKLDANYVTNYFYSLNKNESINTNYPNTDNITYAYFVYNNNGSLTSDLTLQNIVCEKKVNIYRLSHNEYKIIYKNSDNSFEELNGVYTIEKDGKIIGKFCSNQNVETNYSYIFILDDILDNDNIKLFDNEISLSSLSSSSPLKGDNIYFTYIDDYNETKLTNFTTNNVSLIFNHSTISSKFIPELTNNNIYFSLSSTGPLYKSYKTTIKLEYYTEEFESSYYIFNGYKIDLPKSNLFEESIEMKKVTVGTSDNPDNSVPSSNISNT